MRLGYKDNIAWHKNQEAITKTWRLVETLPDTVPFRRIADQLFSSLSSVGANMAEGYSDFDGNEYLRYLKISMRSAYESDHWLTTLKSLASNDTRGINVKLLRDIESLNAETIKILIKTIKGVGKKRRENNQEDQN